MNSDHKILLSASFTLLLLMVRVTLTGELVYIFLAWNLFLAWIPYYISLHFQRSGNRSWLKLSVMIFLWLLFLPNSPYIITDLFHLKQRASFPYWYDVLLVFSAAFNGLLFWLASLLNAENFFKKKFNHRISGFVILCTFFLTSFGVYIGRYLRWNSWDIFFSPGEFTEQVFDRFLNPTDHFMAWAITFLLGIFLYVTYTSLKNLLETHFKQFN